MTQKREDINSKLILKITKLFLETQISNKKERTKVSVIEFLSSIQARDGLNAGLTRCLFIFHLA
jgi:hypothetical protein